MSVRKLRAPLEFLRLNNSSIFGPVGRFAVATLLEFSSCTGLKPSYGNLKRGDAENFLSAAAGEQTLALS